MGTGRAPAEEPFGVVGGSHKREPMDATLLSSLKSLPHVPPAGTLPRADLLCLAPRPRFRARKRGGPASPSWLTVSTFEKEVHRGVTHLLAGARAYWGP